MGLDLTAYACTELIEVMPDYQDFEDKYGWQDDTLHYVHRSQNFPDRLPPIVAGGVYKIHGDRFGFRGGSYSGYGEWRNALALFTLGVEARTIWNNRDGYRGCTFYELIDFSDCEGVIGTIAAAKLAADFDRLQTKADKHPDDYFRQKYCEWRKAFHLAADNGFVNFH